MEYDYRSKKIVAVLSSDLEVGVALNVVGHLAIALGAHAEDDLMGRPCLSDRSGKNHLGIARYPLIITKVKPSRLKRLLEEARETKELLIADYPHPMLACGHDDELAAALLQLSAEEINYYGVAIFGPSEVVNQFTGKFCLWK